jgi:hypothetical protein
MAYEGTDSDNYIFFYGRTNQRCLEIGFLVKGKIMSAIIVLKFINGRLFL